MRKIICAGLALLLALGCTAGAQGQEGRLFLTVSRLVLSYPGASENIYCGTAAPEAVVWESNAPEIVRVENGVVTAAGAGEAEITATLADEQLRCTVVCLADSEAEYDALYEFRLTDPVREPQPSAPGECTFFNDAGFVGDSVTYQLLYTTGREEQIGSPVPLFRRSASVRGFADYTWNVMFRGTEWHIEDAVAESGVKKLFIMLGANDMGMATVEETMERWERMINRILEKSPEVEIYIQSVIPSAQGGRQLHTKNDRIAAYNSALREYAAEHGMHFVEVGCYFEDSMGILAPCYSADGDVHLTEVAVRKWYEILRCYAQRQEQ